MRTTSERVHESALAKNAISDGATTIVCVGGDGTTGNVANVILEAGAAVRLGVIPAGTGNDFAKTLRIKSSSVEEIARLAVQPSDARMDVGLVEHRYFLNSCGFGFDVAVLQGLAKSPWLIGSSVYMSSSIRALFGFRGIRIAINSPAQRKERTLYMMVVIANAPHFGGTFTIAPSASVTDGKLDAVHVVDASPARRMSLLGAATRGRHTLFKEVTVERAKEFALSFDDAPYYERDGEVHRAKSATVVVECVPSALRVLAAPGALANR